MAFQKALLDAYRTLVEIEVSLHEFIESRLREVYGESKWWGHIPQAVRTKCRARQEEELKTKDPYVYTDLLDLKDIIDKKWHPVFENDTQRLPKKFRQKKAWGYLGKAKRDTKGGHASSA